MQSGNGDDDALPTAIIGTGFGGLGMAIQLLHVAFDDTTLFEKSCEQLPDVRLFP